MAAPPIWLAPPDSVGLREREFEIERERPKSAICAAAPLS